MDYDKAMHSHTALPSTTTFVTSTPATSASTLADSIHSKAQAVQNIIFGVLAVTLAFAALVVGWLQLRSFKRRRTDEESAAIHAFRYEILETWYDGVIYYSSSSLILWTAIFLNVV